MRKNTASAFANAVGVLKKKEYAMLTIAVAFFFYLANAVLANLGNIWSFSAGQSLGYATTSVAILLWSFPATIMLHSFLSLAVISLLLGVLVSLLAYKMRVGAIAGGGKAKILASVGAFLGVLAPGCAACGLGVASLLGIGGSVLVLLPYKGFELSLMSIALLCYGIYRTALYLHSCPVKQARTENI
ncbi:TPA: hypothetical protein HA361_01360 [Candidatus Woesearchaeota archaeon]|nr:hypothetical protein [Candidatus Woesearchaeota archaeon]HII68431.1 hypothetical protein [Candidatus Woesearchaeota archaeon]